jgi:hypothetical protein
MSEREITEDARETKRLAIDLPPGLYAYVLTEGGASFVYLLIERHYRDAMAKARAREAAAPTDR